MKIDVTADTASKFYDGTPLEAKGATVTGVPDGFTYEVRTEGSATNVKDGAVNNTVATFIIYDKDKNVVTDQFANINKAVGTLTIKPRPVTLTSESDSKTYDGKALTKPDVTVGGDGFVKSDDVTAKATGSITDVGSVINTIVVSGGTNYDENNYTFTKQEGTLTINPVSAKITIAANNATKMYDGTPLEAPKATVKGLPEGYTAEVTVKGSVLNVGDSERGNNEITGYVIKDASGKIVTTQFEKNEIATVDGTLTITPRKVVLTSATATRTYNGTALNNSKVTVSGDGFVSGEGATYKVTGSRTDAGASDNVFTYTLNNGPQSRGASRAGVYIAGNGATLAENYTISKVEGKLTVNPKTITVTTADATKTYDGTALTAKGRLTGLVSGETVTFRTTGSRTAVGRSQNTYSLKWNGTAKRSNYVIEEKLGTLLINAAAVARTTTAAPAGPAALLPGIPDGPLADMVDNDPPLTDMQNLEDNRTPLSIFDGKWALLNLIFMIATAVISILLLGFYFIKKREDEDEGQEETTKKKLMIRLLGVIPAIVAIITFFLTEDLTQPMELVDRYTILMLLILFVEAFVAFVAKNTTEEEDTEQDQQV